jgi:hypothetical protein
MLVRRLCRLPGEERAEFRRKVARLREHFERFNVDVAELCQWLMGVRPKEPDIDPAADAFWSFFLEPSVPTIDADEKQRDRWRLAVFDCLAGIRSEVQLTDSPLPEPLSQAIRTIAQRPKTPTATGLFQRVTKLDPAHRLVLLKAAAEWVVARYERGLENWKRHRAEWEKEKQAWEVAHPALTEEVRNRFTDVFKSLLDPDENSRRGIRRKNPRICLHERLRENKDNCAYAGEKGHGPLCWKFVDFLRTQKEGNKHFNKKFFIDNAEKYLRFRANSKDKSTALKFLHSDEPRSKSWFESAWNSYLSVLGLTEQTVLGHHDWPHCLAIGETWEKSKCEWNPHTHLCEQYKSALVGFSQEVLALEPEYRKWRKEYLAGPRKPSFKYPSSRKLPMPKIFGDKYCEIDLESSVLQLRLDDMREGEWLEFGFVPWPRKYPVRKRAVNVTSVHVNFLGTRARVGFRFETPHRESRFSCTQDELDKLRSQDFPRQAQDQQFLDAARERLGESFTGDFDRELRLLAVDLGETGACATVYQGRTHAKDVPLRIVKINKSYPGVPQVLEKDKKLSGPLKYGGKDEKRGLRKEHVGRHLKQMKDGVQLMSEHRQPDGQAMVNMRKSDFSGLTRHIRWMIRDWVRVNAAAIIRQAEEQQCDLIVLESMRGFHAPGYEVLDPQKKLRLAMFAYGRIRRKLVEKAVERGMRVVTAPYHLSSQFCSACGHHQEDEKRCKRYKRKENKLRCECSSIEDRQCNCKMELNSDANAARVVARVFWGEILLPPPTRDS